MHSNGWPLYPHGFLLSQDPIPAPKGFVPGPVLKNFWVHPWTDVEVAGNEDRFVIILGQCIPMKPELFRTPARTLLRRLRKGDDAFFDSVDQMGGRHAIIFGGNGSVRILNDASALRTVYYAAQENVIGSHALLVEEALQGRIVRDGLPFQYGYPGNRTPYSRTRILTANTLYSMTQRAVQRFWPRKPIREVTLDEAARTLLDVSVAAIKAFSKNRKIKITLTAGIDSRVVLAAALRAGIDFETYTYVNAPSHKVDKVIAKELSAYAGARHVVLDDPYRIDELNDAVSKANYTGHHRQWIAPLMEHLEDENTAVIMGNALEVGRGNYPRIRELFKKLKPTSAKNMALIHRRTFNSQALARVRGVWLRRISRKV